MGRSEMLRLLEDALDVEPNTLTGDERLREKSFWDSMATLVFIAMVDKHFGVPLYGDQVSRCETVDDLLALIPHKRAAA